MQRNLYEAKIVVNYDLRNVLFFDHFNTNIFNLAKVVIDRADGTRSGGPAMRKLRAVRKGIFRVRNRKPVSII